MNKEPNQKSNALGMKPEDIQNIGKLGAMYYEQGNLDKAQTIFEGLVEADSENSGAQSALGALYTRRGDLDSALKHLDKAIELDDTQIAPFVNRGEVHLRQQNLEAAVADLKRAIKLDPQEKDTGANRARAIVLGIYQEIESQRPENTVVEKKSENN